jgi:hypothetical protein
MGLEPYTGLLTIQYFILRGISRFYPFTSDRSAGHYLKSPNFGLANSRAFEGAAGILEWSWVFRYVSIIPIQ